MNNNDSNQTDFTEAERQALDAAMHSEKLADGYGQRNQVNALRLQVNAEGKV